MLQYIQLYLHNIINAITHKKTYTIDEYFSKLDTKMSEVLTRCALVEKKLENDIKNLNEEVEFYKSMLHTIANTIPDMLWCKGIDGKYTYANTSIKTNLLMDFDVLGKTDVELAIAAKAKYGKDNHTFGEKCANSDLVVIENMVPMRFLESGKIKGRMVYLEVFKAPLVVNNKLVGIVGTGRDLTEYVEALRNDSSECKCCVVTDIFSKYEFE